MRVFPPRRSPNRLQIRKKVLVMETKNIFFGGEYQIILGVAACRAPYARNAYGELVLRSDGYPMW